MEITSNDGLIFLNCTDSEDRRRNCGRHLFRSGVFIVNSEPISLIAMVFLWSTLNT